MLIKEYVKSDKQEDWIDYIIEALRGTCSGSVDHYLDEYLEMGFDEDALYEALDSEIFECYGCGWWVERDDVDDEGYCSDCQDEGV